MSDAEFGDWEGDDALDTEPADPEQVAAHVHEQRAYLSELAGEELTAWEALPEDVQEVAVALADRLITFLTTDPTTAAEAFHESVVFFSNQPEWAELDTDVKEMAIGLIDDVINWLTRQGALR